MCGPDRSSTGMVEVSLPCLGHLYFLLCLAQPQSLPYLSTTTVLEMSTSRTPKVKVTELRPELISFELSGTDVSVANALRRVMIAEVPTLAIELVNFSENTTCLIDEFISHRLGLIPLRSSRAMSQWKYTHECDCKEEDQIRIDGVEICRRCSVLFSLDCDFQKMVQEKPAHQQDLAV